MVSIDLDFEQMDMEGNVIGILRTSCTMHVFLDCCHCHEKLTTIYINYFKTCFCMLSVQYHVKLDIIFIHLFSKLLLDFVNLHLIQ